MTGIVSHNLAFGRCEPQQNCDFQHFPGTDNINCRIGLLLLGGASFALLLHLLSRLDPDDKAQLVTFVITSDLPTTRSGYVNTYQHGGSGNIDHGIRRPQGRSTSVESSPGECECHRPFCTPIKINTRPESLRGQRLHLLLVPGLARRRCPDF
jgi:hypothetical protein